MAVDRDKGIAANLIINYEQTVRSTAVISMLDPQPGELILDVGCGNARDLRPLTQTKCECIGIDFSSKMVTEAKKDLSAECKDNTEIIVGDATKLPFDDEQFDKVYASEVLEHIPDYVQAVSEMSRVLKKGGSLVITTPNREGWYGFDRYVVWKKLLHREWGHPFDEWKTLDELATVLQSNSFAVERSVGICYVPGFYYTYALPNTLQRALLLVVSALEKDLSRVFPRRGYLIGIKASKPQ